MHAIAVFTFNLHSDDSGMMTLSFRNYMNLFRKWADFAEIRTKLAKFLRLTAESCGISNILFRNSRIHSAYSGNPPCKDDPELHVQKLLCQNENRSRCHIYLIIIKQTENVQILLIHKIFIWYNSNKANFVNIPLGCHNIYNIVYLQNLQYCNIVNIVNIEQYLQYLHYLMIQYCQYCK